MRLVKVASAFEAITGIVLVADPSLLAWLLLGATLAAPGVAVARLAGFALLALGLACWPARNAKARSAPTRGLFVYNLLAALFFLYLGIAHELVGILLWPAAAVHAILSVLLGRYFFQADVSKTT
jgi:hypothetical protein